MTVEGVQARGSVAVTVELFGTARMKAGTRQVALELATNATMGDLTRELANQCPAIVGVALAPAEGESGTLIIQEGYAINRNGLEFIPSDADAPLGLMPGDALLLLSNQAGG
jgi:molybdopterin converting factor small subunit